MTIQPRHLDAWYDRGVLLYELRRYGAVQASHDKALTIDPYVTMRQHQGRGEDPRDFSVEPIEP